MEVTHLAPPSVQLVPAKEYNGAPIGTSYDVRAYAADKPDEKLHRRSTVRMGIRVVQMNGSVGTELITDPENTKPPHATVDKPFLLSDGRLQLEASLDKAIYCHGDPIIVNVAIQNHSNKTVRRIKVFIVQHVDVCMFSNGKFKNVVAMINSKDECPIGPGGSLNRVYTLHPVKGATKNWIALEDSYSKNNTSLASTVLCNSPDERNVFAIYVSYYVKVKVMVGAMGGELSLKLPFTLMHSPSSETDITTDFHTSTSTQAPSIQENENTITVDNKQEQDEKSTEEEEDTTRNIHETQALVEPQPQPQQIEQQTTTITTTTATITTPKRQQQTVQQQSIDNNS
ncbi:hypothetical protein O3M35_013244 [Rhynocoris fuscipes]|uniref:Arrestin C-terminal-like domain-containing protein n=1 Tax=Rhynocoris fuscipes TaxID=488301 RepID=A0AAW1CJ64_9HEMI